MSHQRAGDCQALTLTAGQVASALLHRIIELARLLADKILRLRNGQRVPQFFVRGILVAPEQIRANRALEQLCLLHDDRNVAVQLLLGIGGNRLTEQGDLPLRCVIKARNQADERRFAAARAADNADGLPLLCREGHIGQAFRTRALIAQGHMVERHCHIGSSIRRNGLLRECHRRGRIQHLRHAAHAGNRAGEQHDEVRQLHQFHQNLAHVVHQRHHVAGEQRAAANLVRAEVQNADDAEVDHDIRQRIHQRGNAADFELHGVQAAILLDKVFFLRVLTPERAHDADAGEVLARCARDRVQPGLNGFVHRRGDAHDAKDNHRQHGNRREENQRNLCINGEGGNHRARDDERRTQEQAQEHVQTILHLIDVAGHARNQRRNAQRVQFGEGERLDVRHQLMPQPGGCADGGARREILRGEGAEQSDERHQHQQAAARPDVRRIAARNTDLDDVRHHHRHKQVERSFQHLEQGRENALLAEAPEVGVQVLHTIPPDAVSDFR